MIATTITAAGACDRTTVFDPIRRPRDRLAWTVDLEKVVLEDSNDEDDEDNGEPAVASNDGGPGGSARSRWFYASGFLQEKSPETTGDDVDDDDDADANIAGTNLGGEASLHVTCLSRAGHVVSVSVDAAAAADGNAEEGGECIGSFENGLECGGWSPDGEVVRTVRKLTDLFRI